ncbi:MAG: YybH family protein [Pseudomonadales bacterium]
MNAITRLLVVVALVTGQCALAVEVDDEEALRALDQAYATAWMNGDADGVIALFTEDATLVPHHGDTPVKGHKAIRDGWFNPEYPPTVVPESVRDPVEIFVLGDVGVIRGRARLVWEYEGTRTTIPDGNYVMIAVRLDQGWRIRLLTWNDDPRDWLQESIS